MLGRIWYRFLHPQRFWHNASLSEVSELYASLILRSIAWGLVSVFVPFYLFDLGYSFQSIALFYVLFFAIRSPFDLVSGYLVARIGPKHTLIVSYAMQVIVSVMFFGLDRFGWSPYFASAFWAVSNSLFFVALHVDFSKVKHEATAGKEVSGLQVAQKLGMALGPFMGGVVAAVFGPQYIFLSAFFILCVAVVPLMRTPEPVKTHQHITLSTLPKRAILRDTVTYAFSAVENNLRVVIWPLFLSLYALGSAVYLELGSLSSIGLFASVATAYGVGKIVDNKRGRQLLNISASAAAVTHFIRPFVASLPAALLVNTITESTAVGHQIPFHKGVYQKVESLPGRRIAYVMYLESVASTVKFVVWVALWLSLMILSARQMMIVGFILSGICSLGIMLQKFERL